MSTATGTCFHCNEPLGRAATWARFQDSEVPVCCAGCRAAAEMIAQFGLEDFYRFRTAASLTPTDSSRRWDHCDRPEWLEEFTQRRFNGRSAVLLIDGLTCAACSWLIGRSLEQIAGVKRASVNTATGRALVEWDDRRARFSELMRVVASLGYRPHVVTTDSVEAQARVERSAILRRLAVSGLGMMQVMMFAVAMYAGDLQGMDPVIRAYLRGVSMLVAAPVMMYGGWPFFVGACRALRAHGVTMDVPVSLGLILAFTASVVNTVRHRGDVYFDSVTMFVFFLTVARYVEMVARHRSNSIADSLTRTLPAIAHRVSSADVDAPLGDVLIAELKAGDRVLVRYGEAIPADGTIEGRTARVDESMLTGESVAVKRGAGEAVIAGSLNVGEPVQVKITATGSSTVLAGIVALIRRAQAERPRITRVADRMSSRFLKRVLLGTVAVCGFWLAVDPSRAFTATLAVLVVACPCAFSLATLVAVASANAALARRGILVTHQDAIESLTKVTRVVFDKTGTLTAGVPTITHCETLGVLSEGECRRIAAVLESASEHPIARAFALSAAPGPYPSDVRVSAGEGLEGTIDGVRYRIGTPAFALGQPVDDGAIVLARGGQGLARFQVGESVRLESAVTVQTLLRRGLGVEILSGDADNAVRRAAAECGIEDFSSRRHPADKLRHVNELTARGEFIAMVGDGINDAPVLGGAGVSIVMSRGSALALASADLILVGGSLRALPEAFEVARRAKAIIRQNLVWAAAYNLTAMPLAALGWVSPWMAAIGMSTSSILVVLNSLRLMRGTRAHSVSESRGAVISLVPKPLLGAGAP